MKEPDSVQAAVGRQQVLQESLQLSSPVKYIDACILITCGNIIYTRLIIIFMARILFADMRSPGEHKPKKGKIDLPGIFFDRQYTPCESAQSLPQ